MGPARRTERTLRRGICVKEPIVQKPAAPKTVLCLNDLSGAGRCSLAVVLPVLAVMGCQPVALPTLMLSTHTGGLGAPARMDCAEYGRAALAHYRQLGLEVDCVYAGYLAGPAGLALAGEAFAAWPNALKVLDPVMGDGGRLYAGLEELPDGMRALAGRADLILPNLTEACLLLDKPCTEQSFNRESAREFARPLTGLCKSAVVTGLPMGKYVGCAGAGREEFVLKKPFAQQPCHGTGDLFAAVLIGGLLRGNALSAAADAAAEFVAESIAATPPDADARLGLWFEPLLGRLAAKEW